MSFSDRLRRGISVFEFLRTVSSPQSVERSRRIRPVDARTCCFTYKSFSFFSRCICYPQYQMFFRASVQRYALGRWPKAETVMSKMGIPSSWWIPKLPYEKNFIYPYFHNMFVLYLTDTCTITPALRLVRSPVTSIFIVIKLLRTNTFMMDTVSWTKAKDAWIRTVPISSIQMP